MTELRQNDIAPDFILANENNQPISLLSLRGRPVILFFYPKDDSSGCTKEAIQFTELKPQFDALGAAVIGISPDSAAKHKKFREKHGLTPMLLADEDKQTISAYGLWVEKSMYGRKYMGVERSTFLLDKDGKIRNMWIKVKIPGHAAAVLKATEELVEGAE